MSAHNHKKPKKATVSNTIKVAIILTIMLSFNFITRIIKIVFILPILAGIASILHVQSYIAGTFLEISWVPVSTLIYLFDYVCLLPMLFLQEQECKFSLMVQAYNK